MQEGDQEGGEKKKKKGFHFLDEQIFQLLNTAHQHNQLYFKRTTSFQELSAF